MPALSNTVTHSAGGETRRTHTVRLGSAACHVISSVSSGLHQVLQAGLDGVAITFICTDLVDLKTRGLAFKG